MQSQDTPNCTRRNIATLLCLTSPRCPSSSLDCGPSRCKLDRQAGSGVVPEIPYLVMSRETRYPAYPQAVVDWNDVLEVLGQRPPPDQQGAHSPRPPIAPGLDALSMPDFERHANPGASDVADSGSPLYHGMRAVSPDISTGPPSLMHHSRNAQAGPSRIATTTAAGTSSIEDPLWRDTGEW